MNCKGCKFLVIRPLYVDDYHLTYLLHCIKYGLTANTVQELQLKYQEKTGTLCNINKL